MVCSTASGLGSWTAISLPDTASVVTNVYSLNLVDGCPAVVRVGSDGTSPGVYTHSLSPVGASNTWTNVTPHSQFVGRDCSKPTSAVGRAFRVFRGTNATGVGALWQMVGTCAPGVVTFGPISAVVQPDGVLTMGTSAPECSFYSMWTSNINTINLEEHPPRDETMGVCVASVW